ncbi:MAG: ABC transporter permease [Bifidobacteriaceae bacterium]|jgi:ribose transport system permease protein|nr:ABC transporter permease [Bifidobacteriaceae bacterium]
MTRGADSASGDTPAGGEARGPARTALPTPGPLEAARKWTGQHAWVWAVLAAIALWLSAGLISGSVSLRLLAVNASLATFLGLAGVAQMTVIASGDGSFDLSLPYVITFSAVISAGVAASTPTGELISLLVAPLTGIGIGCVTGLLTVWLRMPAMIASLAVGYAVYTGVLVLGSQQSSTASATLGAFIKRQVGGFSVLLACGIAVAVAVAIALTRTNYGRRLHAMGQNRTAAYLSGIRVRRMVLYNFALSGLLAGIVGTLLAAYNDGAFQNMGNTYLLASVAAVVIGGVPVTGGRSSVPAAMVGALVMTLLITILEMSPMGAGYRYILEGLCMILIVVVAQVARRRNR